MGLKVLSKMKSQIYAFFVVAVLAAVSSTDTGEVGLMKFLEKERKERREERNAMRELFQRENDEQKVRIDKQSEEMAKLHDQNRKLHAKLRQADSKIDSKIRQKDQNGSLEFNTKMKSAIRQNDVHSELKKIIKSEISEYLINERICVAGKITASYNAPSGKNTDHNVQFGYTFPRKPIVSTSFWDFYNKGGSATGAVVRVKSVFNSSAVIETYRYKSTHFQVSWIACL